MECESSNPKGFLELLLKADGFWDSVCSESIINIEGLFHHLDDTRTNLRANQTAFWRTDIFAAKLEAETPKVARVHMIVSQVVVRITSPYKSVQVTVWFSQ